MQPQRCGPELQERRGFGLELGLHGGQSGLVAAVQGPGCWAAGGCDFLARMQ